MIIVKNPIYAKLWSLDVKEKYTDIRFSTSEKDRQTGEYINSSWFARMVGQAHSNVNALELEGTEKIVITSAKLTNVYNKEAKKSFLNFIVFDFEVQENDSKPAAAPKEEEEEYPF